MMMTTFGGHHYDETDYRKKLFEQLLLYHYMMSYSIHLIPKNVSIIDRRLSCNN